MTMTTKHFKQFAEMTINLLNDEENTDLLTINNMVDELIPILRQSNNRFNIFTFYDYVNQRASRKLERI